MKCFVNYKKFLPSSGIQEFWLTEWYNMNPHYEDFTSVYNSYIMLTYIFYMQTLLLWFSGNSNCKSIFIFPQEMGYIDSQCYKVNLGEGDIRACPH